MTSARILLVDDDQDMGTLLTECLTSRLSCSVDTATDPFEAMNKISEDFYDLIILDWNLPALTGAQTLRKAERGLNLDPNAPIQLESHTVPVVILSSSAQDKCQFISTKHFRNVGFVSKRQALHLIVEQLAHLFDEHCAKPPLASLVTPRVGLASARSALMG
jgi:CheY-like chemotaxis protein